MINDKDKNLFECIDNEKCACQYDSTDAVRDGEKHTPYFDIVNEEEIINNLKINKMKEKTFESKVNDLHNMMTDEEFEEFVNAYKAYKDMKQNLQSKVEGVKEVASGKLNKINSKLEESFMYKFVKAYAKEKYENTKTKVSEKLPELEENAKKMTKAGLKTVIGFLNDLNDKI